MLELAPDQPMLVADLERPRVLSVAVGSRLQQRRLPPLHAARHVAGRGATSHTGRGATWHAARPSRAPLHCRKGVVGCLQRQYTLAVCRPNRRVHPRRTSALGSPRPNLHLDWTDPARIYTGTGLAPYPVSSRGEARDNWTTHKRVLTHRWQRHLALEHGGIKLFAL